MTVNVVETVVRCADDVRVTVEIEVTTLERVKVLVVVRVIVRSWNEVWVRMETAGVEGSVSWTRTAET